MNKVYVYHHNDHDGIIAAGILYQLLLKNKYKISDIIFNMVDYQKELNFDHIDRNDLVYFLDYSFSGENNRNRLIELIGRIGRYNIIWIDHHVSSIDLLEEYDIPGVRRVGLCGAAWTYIFCKDIYNYYDIQNKDELSEYFHNDRYIPKFLKYIDDYDCWKKLYKETNDIHYGLTISDPLDPYIGTLIDISECFKSLSYKVLHRIAETGRDIQKYLNFENKEYHVNMYGFEYTLPEEHGGYKCFCMNRKGNSLMFGDKVKEYDAVIPFYFNGSRWTYSMFTDKDNVNCEAVAKSYGGGGHLKAAGWTSDKLIFN